MKPVCLFTRQRSLLIWWHFLPGVPSCLCLYLHLSVYRTAAVGKAGLPSQSSSWTEEGAERSGGRMNLIPHFSPWDCDWLTYDEWDGRRWRNEKGKGNSQFVGLGPYLTKKILYQMFELPHVNLNIFERPSPVPLETHISSMEWGNGWTRERARPRPAAMRVRNEFPDE